MKGEKFFGVIYALPNNLANRIFTKHKNIFIKFLAHNTKNIKIKIHNKLLVYISKSNKKITGEAVIKNIEFLHIKELKRKYSNKIFLNNKELNLYAIGREKKVLLVLTLYKIKRYHKERSIDYVITMAGKYINKEEYNKIIGKR